MQRTSFDLSNRSEISASTFRIVAGAESLVKCLHPQLASTSFLCTESRCKAFAVQGVVCSRPFRASLCWPRGAHRLIKSKSTLSRILFAFVKNAPVKSSANVSNSVKWCDCAISDTGVAPDARRTGRHGTSPLAQNWIQLRIGAIIRRGRSFGRRHQATDVS